jgi:hypothetical protein
MYSCSLQLHASGVLLFHLDIDMCHVPSVHIHTDVQLYPVVPGLFDTIKADIVPCIPADTLSGPENPPIDSGDFEVLVMYGSHSALNR